LCTAACSIGIGLVLWIVAPEAFVVILLSDESATVHPADVAFVYKDGTGLEMIAAIITMGAVVVALFPAIATVGLDISGKNFKHAAIVIPTASVSRAAVTWFHTGGRGLGECADRTRRAADSF